MRLNLTHDEIDRLRGHARMSGGIKGEALLDLLQDWVTLKAEVEKRTSGDTKVDKDGMDGMPFEGRN